MSFVENLQKVIEVCSYVRRRCLPREWSVAPWPEGLALDTAHPNTPMAWAMSKLSTDSGSGSCHAPCCLHSNHASLSAFEQIQSAHRILNFKFFFSVFFMVKLAWKIWNGSERTLELDHGVPFQVHMDMAPSGVSKHRVTTNTMRTLGLGLKWQRLSRCFVMLKKQHCLVFCSYNVVYK